MPEFHSYRNSLLTQLAGWPDVEGLIWAGSSAEVDRADEWSDLDFFVMVRSGEQERFRRDLSWLPANNEIAWFARETAHGLKVVFQDGFVLEFAVFDREELSLAVVNHHALEFGDEDLAVRLESIYRPEAPSDWLTLDDRLGLACALLLIGAGRYARGERLVGGQFVRSYAVREALAAAKLALTPANAAVADSLDAWRRAEQVYPDFARDIEVAANLPVPQAAKAISEVLRQHFGDRSTVPAAAVEVLDRRLP